MGYPCRQQTSSVCQMRSVFASPSYDLNQADRYNQILGQVLNLFPSQSLIQYSFVCHRFRDLINRIIHERLLKAASLKDHKLILECYHPTAQYTEPYLLCEYLGTPGLSDINRRESSTNNGNPGIRELGTLYSRFLPRSKDAESDPRVVRPHPAGDVPGSRTSPTPYSSSRSAQTDIITRAVSMESHELFSQLCVSASLVQVGPRRGVFLSCMDVLKKTTTRMFRDWLGGKTRTSNDPDPNISEPSTNGTANKPSSSSEQSRRLMWVDPENNVGLRVLAHERKWMRNAPILIHQDEDQAISYSLELVGRLWSIPPIIEGEHMALHAPQDLD